MKNGEVFSDRPKGRNLLNYITKGRGKAFQNSQTSGPCLQIVILTYNLSNLEVQIFLIAFAVKVGRAIKDIFNSLLSLSLSLAFGLNIFIPQYVHEQYKDMQKH